MPFTIDFIWAEELSTKLTHIGEIVDQNHMANQFGWWTIEHGMHGAQQHRPCLIVEAYNHIGWWKISEVTIRLLAPAMHTTLMWKWTDELHMRMYTNLLSAYHGSLGSGRLRCIDIKSDAYWLNAFLSQPSSTDFFISTDIFVGKMTGRPISPGASGELSTGGIRTPLSAM